MNENDKGQRELLAKLAAVGLGAIAGGAIGGPIGAAVVAVGALGLAENLLKPEPPKPPTRLPSLVVLASRATQFRKYLSHLSPGQKITEKTTCELLYKNSKYIWRGTQKEFEALKEEVERLPAENPNDESAFYLVALETDEELPGLAKDASPLKRRDAFLALCSKAKIVWISPPLHLNPFANKDFYLV